MEDASVTYMVRANGVSVASVTVTHSGGLGYWIPHAIMAPTAVRFNDGDVIDFAIDFEGCLLSRTIGLSTYGDQQGVFVMTRTGS